MAADGVWMVVQPQIVRAPATMLAHHTLTILLLVHALSYAPHLRYVAWLASVEVNTLMLIARRHFKRGWIELAFYASWVVIRMCWFPYVALQYAPSRLKPPLALLGSPLLTVTIG